MMEKEHEQCIPVTEDARVQMDACRNMAMYNGNKCKLCEIKKKSSAID